MNAKNTKKNHRFTRMRTRTQPPILVTVTLTVLRVGCHTATSATTLARLSLDYAVSAWWSKTTLIQSKCLSFVAGNMTIIKLSNTRLIGPLLFYDVDYCIVSQTYSNEAMTFLNIVSVLWTVFKVRHITCNICL